MQREAPPRIEAVPHARMLGSVFTKNVRDGHRALLLWSLGVLLMVFIYAAFWPSASTNADQLRQYIEKLPELIRNMVGNADYGTPVGYVQTEIFSFMMPILLLVYAIGAGARAIAGEEEVGTLDLLLSTPISRRRVLLDKVWAMMAGTLALATVVWLSLVVLGPLYDLHVPLSGLTAATLNLFLLGTAFGMLALLAGVVSGSRGAAIGASSGLAVGMFVLNTLAPSVDALRPVRFLSAFHYYSGHAPLTSGFGVGDVLVLGSAAVVFLVAALVAFQRRDLSS